MLRRVGRTAREQLRWVIAFAERDLGVLRDGERIALMLDLVWLPGRVMQSGPTAPPGPGPDLPLSRGKPVPTSLDEAHREVGAALHAYFEPEGLLIPSPEVRLRPDPASGQAQAVYSQGPSVVAGIVLAVATLISRVGPAFRKCPTCARPFVRSDVQNNRQAFCSPACSMRMRRQRYEAAKTTPKRKGKTQ